MVNPNDFPKIPPFDTEKPITLEKAKWDLSALDCESLITIHCVGCKTEAKYGNSLEGVARLYFASRWTIVNKSASQSLAGASTEIEAICETCLKRGINHIQYTTAG